jgi:hypothetical protein
VANTFVLISSVTVGAGGASSIDFTSIPATYTDLCLVLSGRGSNSAASTGIKLKLNNVSTNFTNREIYADGSTVGSYTGTDGAGYVNAATGTASTFNNWQIYIPNYAGSTNKSYSIDYVRENNTTANDMGMYAGLWSNTSTINQITVTINAGTFVQYSTAYLYGIKNS